MPTNGRPLVYPPPRYAAPIVMHPAAFDWVASSAAPGLDRKHLGTFNECRTTIGFLRYAAGARHRVTELAAPELHFILEGALSHGGRRHERWTALMVEPGDDIILEAAGATESFVIGLPALDRSAPEIRRRISA
jgi:hypothetical protein